MDLIPIAGMIFSLILIAMVGTFILLIPLSRRLGQALDVWLQERRQPALGNAELAELTRALQALEGDVERLAERQQFTEKLLEGRTSERPALPGQPTP